VLTEAAHALSRQGRLVLCQIVRAEGSTPGKVGWKLAVLPDGGCYGNLGGGAFEALVTEDARAVLEESRSGSQVKRYYFTEEAVRGEATGMVCGGLAEVFLEVMMAPPILAICGGGPVGQALAQGGQLAGFEIVVADDRAKFRRSELFPDGVHLATVRRDYREDFLELFTSRELFVAVVTRCWETDVAAMRSVLRQAPAQLTYLGLMGSQRKVERVQEVLAEQGFDLSGVPLHAPIGLPIGGDSPGEIAVSIVGEMLQARYRR
jgi:xanthine dehydrogenase accessory factor